MLVSWRRLIAALALVVAGAVALSSLHQRPLANAGLRVGVVANALDGGVGELDLARNLGVGYVREEIRWKSIEPVRGARRWSATDRLFEAAAQRRLRVLPLIITTPRWQAATELTLPPTSGPWAAFVARAAARYGPRGAFWRAHPRLAPRLAPDTFELWNEPYFAAFSQGGVDPARYATLSKAAIDAGRRANPRARFIIAAETTYRGTGGEDRDWLGAVFRAQPGLARIVEGVAVHPYVTGSPLRPHANGSFRRLDAILASLATRGAARRLWITEIGWSTCRKRPDCVTSQQQAAYLRQVFELVRDDYATTVKMVVVYRLRDLSPPAPQDPQRSYGVLDRAGTPKPSWDVVHRSAIAAGTG